MVGSGREHLGWRIPAERDEASHVDCERELTTTGVARSDRPGCDTSSAHLLACSDPKRSGPRRSTA
jgi:hypothetical protein